MSVWEALWSVMAVHATELEREGVIDESGLRTIARVLDSLQSHVPDSGSSLDAQLNEFENRSETLLPAEFSGVMTLGLAREDCRATAVRLLWSDRTTTSRKVLRDLRLELASLAEAHAMTLMPAMIAGRPAQPTMLGHFLGGAISPLASAAIRLEGAAGGLNRSPLGSGLMAGDMIAIDRDRAARALGFAGPIPNTFDAVANVEDFVAVLQALESALAPVHRLLGEFASWIRTSPNSFVLADSWESRPEPAVPSLRLGVPLLVLMDRMAVAQAELGTMVVRLRTADYAPLGHLQSVLADCSMQLIPKATGLLSEARQFLVEGMLVNRAFLGNRAGRGYTTAGDLASFLMTEEQLPPSVARGIASMVAAKLSEQSLETSAVTQEMIDSAALMLLGREIKVEIETLGRYLAPRRFIERRKVTGSPAADELQAWLKSEREAIENSPTPVTGNALDDLKTEIIRLANDDQD